MRKFISIFSILFFCLINKSYSNADDSTKINYNCKIFCNKYDILYEDFTNIINIEIDSGVSYDSLFIKTELGLISGEKGKFKLFVPNEIGRYPFIEIIVIYNKSKIIGKRTFILRRKDEIIPILSNNKQYSISKNTILSDPYLRILRNDSIDNNMSILSFRFSSVCDMSKNSFHFQRFSIKGNKLDKMTLNFLGFASPGQFIYLENIKIKDNKGVVSDLPPIIYQLNGRELIEGYYDDYPSDNFIDCEIIKYLPR